MKVLLTNNHFHTYGGTESWNYTVYKELIRLGFDVDVFAVYTDMVLYDLPVRSSIDQSKEYDLILCTHNSTYEHIVKYAKWKKLKFISHGKYHPIENPMPGCDEYIAISEEVRNHVLKLGFKHCKVILNPIDLDEFYPMSHHKKGMPMLSLCQGDHAKEVLKSYFNKNIGFIKTERDKRKKITAKQINKYNIVFGLGRSAYEALACGRCVIVYDARDYMGENYDGIITHKNINNLVAYNCSGRMFGNVFRATFCYDQIDKFYTPNIDYYRAIAEQYFDSKKIVQQLIE